jgi:hypothetical protein
MSKGSQQGTLVFIMVANLPVNRAMSSLIFAGAEQRFYFS